MLTSLISKDPHVGHTKLDMRHPAHFEHQGAQVWRVEWNVTGTILASSGDDGCVRLWKGEWTFLTTCHLGGASYMCMNIVYILQLL